MEKAVSGWVKSSEMLPEKYPRPQDSDPDLNYDFSVTVLMKADPGDRMFFRLYPGGIAPGYFDFEDQCWQYSDLSGGPWMVPIEWHSMK